MVVDPKGRSGRHQKHILPHDGPRRELKTHSSRKRKDTIPIHRAYQALWTLLLLSPTLILLNSLSSDAVVRKGYALRRLPSENLSVNCDSAKTTGKKPTYVFLHLHKTGGNNLKLALFGFAKRNKLILHHTCRPSKGESALKSWWFNRRKTSGISTDCDLNALAQMPRNLRDSYDFIVGHQYFGVHRLLHNRDVNYFTIVRHPLARKVSHYAHFEVYERTDTASSKPVSNASAAVDQGEDDQVLLAKYLLMRNRNYMVKRLSSARISSEIVSSCRSWYIDVNPFAANAALRSAKMHLLDRFFFVGVQERYGESICVLACILNSACYADHGRISTKKLNSAKIYHAKENYRGSAGRRLAALPRSVRLAAFRSENLDMELYVFANKLLDSRLYDYPHCSSTGGEHLKTSNEEIYNAP